MGILDKFKSIGETIESEEHAKKQAEEAQQKIETIDWMAAYHEVEKELAENPKSSEAWLKKMDICTKLATLENSRVNEFLDAGENALNCAEDHSIEKMVFQKYADYALSLLTDARDGLLDNKVVKEMYRTFKKETGSRDAASEKTQSWDVQFGLYDSLRTDAMKILSNISDKGLMTYRSLIILFNDCAAMYEEETQAAVDRLKIYKLNLSRAAKKQRRNEVDALYARAKKGEAHLKSKTAPKYWKSHPEEKEALETKRENLETQAAKLSAEYKDKTKIKASKIEMLQEDATKLKVKRKEISIKKVGDKLELTKQINDVQQQIDSIQDEILEMGKKVDEETSKIIEEIKKIDDQLTYGKY